MKLYVCGTTQQPASQYAREAMEFIRNRGDECWDWFRVYEEVTKGDMRREDALAANKRAVSESEGVVLVLPCRQNGCAEAAFAAGLDIPVVVWQAAKYNPTEYEQVLALVGKWEHGNLETCLGWLKQVVASLARGKAQADAE